MTTQLLPSRRVFDELHAEAFVTIDARGTGSGTTPVARAWIRLDAALDAHIAALAELDRIEAVVIAAHGFPRVPLPTAPEGPLEHAADTATIDRRVSDHAVARRLKLALRRRQRDFSDAASAAGLASAQQREARTAGELDAATAALLLAPTATRSDLALKLVVLISIGEPSGADAWAFPWLYLRTLLADLRLAALDGPTPP